MRYIKDLKEGSRLQEIYLCKVKTQAETKNGKPYHRITLMDKTGSLESNVWEPYSAAIEEYEAGDFIEVMGTVNVFNGALQGKIDRIRKCSEGEYDPREYYPSTDKDVEEMYAELLDIIATVKTPCLQTLLKKFFIDDEMFVEAFKKSSAAKSVHHGFIGGLLEHTLSVTKLCIYYTSSYAYLNYDLLITAAICHDMGKTRELSLFPENDYTDMGQLLGHIVLGAQMVAERAKEIEGFPAVLLHELQHCILAHHGEYEYGSPKKPAIAEAVALNYADNTDAKLETFKELLEKSEKVPTDWLGYNKLFESNMRKTSEA